MTKTSKKQNKTLDVSDVDIAKFAALQTTHNATLRELADTKIRLDGAQNTITLLRTRIEELQNALPKPTDVPMVPKTALDAVLAELTDTKSRFTTANECLKSRDESYDQLVNRSAHIQALVETAEQLLSRAKQVWS
jgi:chromosome segregation ATPase